MEGLSMGDKRENKGGEESGKGSKWAGERQRD